MNKPLHDIELIERYFDPEITDVEKQNIEEQIKTDTHLKTLFEREKLLVNTICFEGARENLEFLKNVEKTIEKPGAEGIKWYYYAAAASVVLAVLAGIFIPFSKPTPQELYAEYFTPYPNLFEPTLRSSEAVTSRSEAFSAYEQRDYKRSAELFSALLKEKEEPGILLLLGNSNLSIGNTQEAIKNFNELINKFDDLDIQAKWFLSLCYLQNGETERARKLLEELGETEISYASKAKGLLRKMH